jgi:sec-independent protein translocase protein TatA
MIDSLFTPTHILLILAVALIVLGPKRLPEAGRGLGSAIRDFKESLSLSASSPEQPALEPSSERDQAPTA